MDWSTYVLALITILLLVVGLRQHAREKRGLLKIIQTQGAEIRRLEAVEEELTDYVKHLAEMLRADNHKFKVLEQSATQLYDLCKDFSQSVQEIDILIDNPHRFKILMPSQDAVKFDVRPSWTSQTSGPEIVEGDFKIIGLQFRAFYCGPEVNPKLVKAMLTLVLFNAVSEAYDKQLIGQHFIPVLK